MRNQHPIVWIVLAGMAATLAALTLLGPAAFDEAVWSYGVVPARFTIASERPHDLLGYIGPVLGHMFLHGGLLHLLFNSIVILQVGGPLARRLDVRGDGAARFLALFLACGVGGALAYVLINPHSSAPAIGASGAACGLVAAFLIFQAGGVNRVLRDPQTRSAGFWFLVVNVGLAAAARYANVIPIAWEAHLGGFLAGALVYPLIAPSMTRSSLAIW